MSNLLGVNSYPLNSVVTFTHRGIVPNTLFVYTGVNSVKWSYILNTSTTPTVGGEVVQILSCTVGPITIQGATAGWPTDGTDPSDSIPGYDLGARSPHVELLEIQDWFRQYMFIAGSATGDREFRDETAVRFKYPARGWDFYIQPTNLEGFKFSTDQYAPEWSITAEVVSDHARSIMQLETMGQFTNDLTKRSILAQMNYSAFDTLGNKNLESIDPTWKLGNTNPFRTPPSGGFGGNSLLDELATTMGDNFHRLLSAWVFENPVAYLNPLAGNPQLPQDWDSKYSLDVRHTAGAGGSTDGGLPDSTGGSTDSSSGNSSSEGSSAGGTTAKAGACDQTADQIDKFLSSQGSKMAGQGQAFVNARDAYGVSAAFLVGLAGQESSFGNNLSGPPHGGTFNAFNYGGKNYTSWAAAINDVAKHIADPSGFYFGRQRYSALDVYLDSRWTPERGQPAWSGYCSGGCNTGVLISSIVSLGGDPNDIRCGGPDTSATPCGKPAVNSSLKSITHGTMTPIGVVLHDTDGATTASGTIGYLNTTPEQLGIHFVIEPDGTIYQAAPETALVYHTGGANTGHIGIEQCCPKGGDRAPDWWASHPAILESVAQLLAYFNCKYMIPLTMGTNSGISTHAMQSAIHPESLGHTDPGPFYPITKVMDRARQIAASRTQP